MIRKARRDDLDAIGAIWNRVIRETVQTFTTVEKDAAALDALWRAQPIWVAEEAGTVIGLATYGPFRTGPGYARTVEHSVYLHRDARGRGLGRALLAACEDHARAAGHHAMVAGISGENAQALAFHAAMGYAKAGHLPQVGRKFDRWHDLVLMVKLL